MVDRINLKQDKFPSGEFDVISPLNALVGDGYKSENQWGSGGVNAPQTGPDFGCIHWETK